MPTPRMTRRDVLALAAGVLTQVSPAAAAPRCRAGVASIDITPEPGLWMAGFARRKLPAQGTALPLKAKALALQYGDERPAVIVTTDLLGVTARLTDVVARETRRRAGIPRANLLFNASHTHCGPVIDEQLSVAYDLSPDHWSRLRAYSASLETKLSDLIATALAGLRPASIGFARGEAAFARNRRVQFSPDGPVDRSVPVLRVTDEAGALRAVLFGYACHNTTLQDSFVQYHGDYAGVAQSELERRHPGTVAMFVAGCGADANPHPRGTLELVEAHGRALADAVERVLPASRPVGGGLRTSYGTAVASYESAATRQAWRAKLEIDDAYLRRYDGLMKETVTRTGRLPAVQDVPVQVWQFGGGSSTITEGLMLIALGGEAVVDYALRFRREFPGREVWSAGYSNDVFGYLPSRRIREEGGYEGADAMVYYGRPGPFAADVEERVVREVRRLAR